MARERPDALLINPDPLLSSRREQIVTLANHYKLPTLGEWREFAEAGGLMSYGPSHTEPYRLIGIYTGRILKGAKPAELPVMQSTKFELVINLRTAKALGLTIPNTVSRRQARRQAGETATPGPTFSIKRLFESSTSV
jgi:putative ABC transport system substrate-binding protein